MSQPHFSLHSNLSLPVERYKNEGSSIRLCTSDFGDDAQVRIIKITFTIQNWMDLDFFNYQHNLLLSSGSESGSGVNWTGDLAQKMQQQQPCRIPQAPVGQGSDPAWASASCGEDPASSRWNGGQRQQRPTAWAQASPLPPQREAEQADSSWAQLFSLWRGEKRRPALTCCFRENPIHSSRPELWQCRHEVQLPFGQGRHLPVAAGTEPGAFSPPLLQQGAAARAGRRSSKAFRGCREQFRLAIA
uniref:Uncharacterized protein n=1 Tax=Sphaerodactylus townsendi TaxID=933632 RepID=A0ACB8FB23_9SAUR